MEITVPFEELERRLIMRQAVGDGICEGYDFEVSITIPGCSPVITVNDKNYMIRMNDIVHALILAIAPK